MFGFIVGTVCLFGLIAVLKKSHHRGFSHGHCGRDDYGRGDHDESDYGESHHPRRHRGMGRRGQAFMLRRLFERLDTTPGQEKVIRAETGKLQDAFKSLKREKGETQRDLAKALRGESFDETIMGDLFTRHDDRMRELRLEVVGAFARTHEALDERQRDQLADLLERGPGRRFFRGPYR